MKATTAPLTALLGSGKFVRADIWTITLNGGGVVRWTSHDADVIAGGNRFLSGPSIQRGAISEKVGVEVSTLRVTIDAIDSDLINGVPVIAFIAAHGLDGASVKLERAYAPAWGLDSSGAPIPVTGTVIRFAGKVTSVESIMGGTAEFTVSSWLVLLNAQTPRNHFQVGCMRTLYDVGCGVNPASFSATGTVTSGGTTGFGSGLTGVAGYYSQGRLVFLTGANAGISRTVKSNDGSGNFSLIKPLPAACAAGDTFTAYAGCDLTKATCSSKFANLTRFKGTPFVPLPTAALGAPATTLGGGSK
jgi:uncharacterized phage protein (TIGR02218 family)